MMDVHGLTKDGSVIVDFGEGSVTVPNDPENRHRRMIAEWELQGNIIPPYSAPQSPQ